MIENRQPNDKKKQLLHAQRYSVAVAVAVVVVTVPRCSACEGGAAVGQRILEGYWIRGLPRPGCTFIFVCVVGEWPWKLGPFNALQGFSSSPNIIKSISTLDPTFALSCSLWQLHGSRSPYVMHRVLAHPENDHETFQGFSTRIAHQTSSKASVH